MAMEESAPTCTFQQLNTELNELYDYLKTENYSEEEIRHVFSPLISKVHQEYRKTAYKILTVIAVLIASLYFLTYIDSVYWHLSAVGRILMIQVLPYFDWRYLKNRQCLIGTLNSSPKSDRAFFNCDLCEGINKIDVYEKIEGDVLAQRYIELDLPLIVSNALDKWPKNSSFVEQLNLDDVFHFSYPCKLSTNTQKDQTRVGDVLQKIKLFDEFFLHFQNCDPDAVRRFRRFTYRPGFLPSTYSPILYNWLVWSRNYNTTNYKQIELVERMAVFAQLFGSTYIQLIPRQNCVDVCPILNIRLNAGEALIFTSLWDLEYRPEEHGENMAVILETKV